MKRVKFLLFAMLSCMAFYINGCEKKSESVKKTEATEYGKDGTEKADDTEAAGPVQIITEKDIEDIVEIDFYYSDEKNVISDKAAIKEIAEEIAKLRLEDVVPENQWFEGGMMVELIMENGDTIYMSCGDSVIGFDKQYYVKNQMYSLIMEKGKEQEEKSESVKRTEATEFGKDGTEAAGPVQIITEKDIEDIVEIDFYYSDEKNVISDKAVIEEIAMEIAKLRLEDEDAVPKKHWLEGGMGVDLILENGNIIKFGCGNSYIGFDKQYYVDKDLYSLIMEKGKGKEQHMGD